MLQLTEFHQVHRLLDKQADEMLTYCKDCDFAVLKRVSTLETLWVRLGSADTVCHSGGILTGLTMDGSTRPFPNRPEAQPPPAAT